VFCPYCKALETRVVDSRLARDQQAVRRRRKCDGCGQRFTTYERVEWTLPTVIKRDGRREPFKVEKIRVGVELACQKRPVPAPRMDALIAAVERYFAERGEREVTTRRIGEEVLSRLRNLDEVAYVRFASVYREFSDVRQFFTELEQLRSSEAQEEE
jgi:transcriptional repressor NrdR